MNDGVYADLKREQYDLLERTNFSKLSKIAISPAHYRHGLMEQDEQTDALKVGRAGHVATFEPERFLKQWVKWDGGRRAGKDWERFRGEHEPFGREILTEAEFDLCVAVQKSVRNSAMAAPYLTGGQGEVTLLWTYRVGPIGALPGYSFEMKSRIDFLAKIGAITDLKIVRSAEPQAFGRACVEYRWHSRAACYVDAYKALTGKTLPYIVVAVEKKPPHITQVYRIPEHVLQFGRDDYRGMLDRLHLCKSESRYPGYADDVLDLELPTWALPQDDEDPTGLGLEIRGHDAA